MAVQKKRKMSSEAVQALHDNRKRAEKKEDKENEAFHLRPVVGGRQVQAEEG